MDSKRFEKWLKTIYLTQDEEISCTECFEMVSHFVEVEVSGGNPADEMPQVVQHLHQCPACRDEYETLRDLRRSEEEGDSPSLDQLRGKIH